LHSLAVWLQTDVVPVLGTWGVFLLSFLDSSILSLPEVVDVLVISAAVSDPGTAWLWVLMATLGSVAGCSIVWWIGDRGGEPFLERRFGTERVLKTRRMFERWELLALALPALLPPPFPFKIFVISAGVFGVGYKRFALTLLGARAIRFGLWGLLGVLWGEEALSALKEVDSQFHTHRYAIAGVAAVALVVAFGAWAARRRRAPAES